MHAQSRPAIRRYTVSVPDAGTAAPVRWGDTHPNLLGWDVAYKTTHGSDSAMIVGIWTCREDWYQQAAVEYGDATTGTIMTQGGRVFLPYSTISLLLYGQNGVGNATVEILATPVMCGEVPQGNAHLYGLQSWSAEASAAAEVSVPENANMFAVARGETDATPFKIEAIGLTNQVFWSWTWDANSVQAGIVTRTPWRECPLQDNTGVGDIKITNGDGANNARGFVWFRFDFNQGR